MPDPGSTSRPRPFSPGDRFRSRWDPRYTFRLLYRNTGNGKWLVLREWFDDYIELPQEALETYYEFIESGGCDCEYPCSCSSERATRAREGLIAELKDELNRVHQRLDELGVPRHDDESLVQRVHRLIRVLEGVRDADDPRA